MPKTNRAVRRGCVDAFVHRDKLNSEAVEFGERVHQMPNAPREPVVPIDDDHVVYTLAAADEKLVEPWAVFIAAADSDICERAGDVPSATPAQFPQFAKLHGRILSGVSADARVQCRSHFEKPPAASVSRSHARRFAPRSLSR